MNRRKKFMAAAAGLIAAGTMAVTTPAHAAPAAATPWSQVWIISQRNHYCAFWSSDNRLAPIFAVGCSVSTWWWCRQLNLENGQGWGTPGDHYECVDQKKTYMFGESGGQFKLETPNSNDYIQDNTSFAAPYEQEMYVPNNNYFASGPAETALGVMTTEPSGYGWVLTFEPTP